MKTEITPITFNCLRCGYEWIPRIGNPRQCPRCKTAYWDTQKNKEKVKIIRAPTQKIQNQEDGEEETLKMTTEAKLRASTDIEEISPTKTVTSTAAPPPTNRRMETIQLTKRLQITNPEGKVTYDTRETPSHSFVVAFMRGLWACFTRSHPRTTDIFGRQEPLIIWGSTRSMLFFLNAGAGETRFGPVIGTGTKPPNNHDSRLDAQILHGTGTNQIIYKETSLGPPAEVAGTLTITIHRTYTNQSPATITISECGIYSANHHQTYTEYHCIVRDLVSPATDVPVGHTVLLEYRIQTRA